MRRPVPVRPAIETLEKRDMFSVSGLSVNPAPSPTEAATTATFTVATFTGSSSNVADYSGTVTWGDGTTSTFNRSSGLSSTGSNSYSVQLSHKYIEEATSTVISVSVHDASDNTTSATVSSSSFSIADAALSSLVVLSPGATEGLSTGSVRVANFTDANTAAPVTDFTAVIAWGDNSTTTVVGGAISGIVSLGGGNFTVRSSHTYAEDGTYTLSVQILDIGGASISASQTIAVADAALSNLSLKPLGLTEGNGASAITVATFTDKNKGAPNTDFTAVVQWGDSSTTTVTGSGIVALGSGNFAVLANHTYAEESTYTLSVQVIDVGGASVSGTRTIAVADAALINLAVPAINPTEGTSTGTYTVATFTDRYAAAPNTDFTAVVQWGDGSTTTVTGSGIVALGSGNFAVLAGYTYIEEGTYTLSVQILDVGGASVSGSRKVTVAEAPLSNLVLSDPGATEGIGLNAVTVATFNDANTSATVGAFTATVTWGDGGSSAASVVATGTPGLFAVLGSYTYAEETTSPITLSVVVLDDDGSSASVSGSITIAVADAPLSNLVISDPGATEAQGFSGVTVATFSDANTGAPFTDFTATVTWGDGGSSAASVVATGTPGLFAVLAGYTYAEDGTYTLSVDVLDIGGASVTGAATIPVADAPLSNLVLSDPGATEAQGFSGFTVATFSDANTSAPATDFTATVTWGDGGSSAASVVATGTPGLFAVLAGYTYAEEGTYTLSVDVLDEGGASVSGGITVAVADAALGSLNLIDPGATEGFGFSGVTVATFSDANTGAPVTDFTATVTWGDGGSSAASVVATGTPGLFAVLGSYTYVEEGTYTLSVDVLDDGGATVSGSITVSVAEAPLSNLVLSDPGATEGIGLNAVTVATFNDANTSATVGAFTATVTWGDGGSSAASVVATGTPGLFAVLGSYTYAEETTGPITLSVVVLDDDGSSASVSGSITIAVADAPLSNLVISNPGATEGIGLRGVTVATFTDANIGATNTDFAVTIAWGDGINGNPPTRNIVVLGGGNFAVLGNHTYADEGTYTLSVQVTDVGGASITVSQQITAADAPLSGLVVLSPGATEGLSTGSVRVANFTDANPSAPISDFTAVIAWGDSSTTTVTGSGIVSLGGGNFTVRSSHTYAEDGPYTLSVQILDEGGASISASQTIAVADAALSNLSLKPLGLTEGNGASAITVATFTDKNKGAPNTDFTAVVQWGDSSTTTVTGSGIVALGSGNFAVLANHTYAEEGPYTFTVQVTDVAGASISGSRAITVADAALINLAVQNINPTHGVGTGTYTVATFTDRYAAAPSADFTAVVQWGDSTTTTVTGANVVSLGGGSFALLASHTYASSGTVTLSVQVNDIGGASISGFRKITVS